MILLLLFLLVPGTLTTNNGQSCRFCQEMCSSTASNDSALCKCDADCQAFSDCCGNHTPPSSCPASQLSLLPDGVMLECISTYLDPNIPVMTENEAFLMVSTCPDTWIDERWDGITEEICTSPPDFTPLPPVTNTATGIIYRNEYCALCNGVREMMVAWQTNLFCKPKVYNLLKSQSISEIVLSRPDIFQMECYRCSFQIPPILTSGNTAPTRSRNYRNIVPRSCFPRVSRCLPHILLEIKMQRRLGNNTYALMEEKCASGMLDLVRSTGSGVVYRNVDCAICNGENVTTCVELPQIITNRIPYLCLLKLLNYNSPNISPPPYILPYTITLSNLGGSMVEITTKSGNTNIYLDCPEGTAPVGLECRPTICPEGYSETGGRCSYVFPSPLPGRNFTIENCSTAIFVYNGTDYIDLGNNTIILVEDKSVVVVVDYDELGHPLICIGNVSFLDCPTSLVPLNESDYNLGNDSNSILFKNKRVEVIFYDEYGRPLVFSDNTTITIITNTTTTRLQAALPWLQELTYIGCSLSVLGSILILLTYTLFSECRTLPGLILMNLCTTILATNLIFITGGPVVQSYSVKELCSSLGIVLHFSYLSQFSWLSIFSFEIVRKLYQARKLSIDSNKTKHQFFVAYLCIGWCLPLLISAISITLNFSVDGLVLYGVDKDGRMAECWINHFESFIIAFLIPLILSISSNLIMLFLTTFLICRVSRDRSKLQTSNTFTLIRVWLAVLSTSGLTWIFGFVAILDQANWMWYPFVIFNSTQGFTMFLAFLFTKNTLRVYLDYFLTCKRKVTISKNGPTKVSMPCTTHTSAKILHADRKASDTNISKDIVVKKCRVEASCTC